MNLIDDVQVFARSFILLQEYFVRMFMVLRGFIMIPN